MRQLIDFLGYPQDVQRANEGISRPIVKALSLWSNSDAAVRIEQIRRSVQPNPWRMTAKHPDLTGISAKEVLSLAFDWHKYALNIHLAGDTDKISNRPAS